MARRSRLDVVNRALLLLGDIPVSDFPGAGEALATDAPGAGVTAAHAVYDDLKSAALTRVPWRFATRQVSYRGSDEDTPVYGHWQYTFPLPGDYIQALGIKGPDGYRITTGGALDTKQVYEIYGKDLVTVYQNIQLEYTANVDEDLMTASFAMGFSMELAGKIAMAVTGSERLMRGWLMAAEEQYGRAATTDAQARPMSEPPIDPLRAARWR